MDDLHQRYDGIDDWNQYDLLRDILRGAPALVIYYISYTTSVDRNTLKPILTVGTVSVARGGSRPRQLGYNLGILRVLRNRLDAN